MPTTGREARGQRARWEGGRLNAAIRWAPRLLRGVAAGRLRLLEPLLDLLLLPLAYHAALLSLLLLLPWTPGRIWGAFGFAVLAFHVALAPDSEAGCRDLAFAPRGSVVPALEAGAARPHRRSGSPAEPPGCARRAAMTPRDWGPPS